MKRFVSCFSFLVLLFCSTLQAQTDVVATVQVTPPYSPYLSTYVDQPNKILLMLTNTTGSPLRLKLWVQIKGDNGVSVTTSGNFNPSQPITLNAYETKPISFNTPETRDYFDANHVDLVGITRAQLIQNQALPEGNYTICVRAVDYALPYAPRSADACASFPLFYIDPPMAIQPTCGNDIAFSNPQFVLFSWSPPATAPGNIQYEFTLKEVPNTMNPNDVIKNDAFPVIYNTTQNGNTTLIYNVALPQLEEGKKYVWRVKAVDPNNSVQFKNSGYSEACVFKYGSATSNQPTLNTSIVNSSAIKPVNQTQFLPSTTITGKLQWSFRKTEEGGTPVGGNEVFAGSLDQQVTLANVSTGSEYTFGAAAGLGSVPPVKSPSNSTGIPISTGSGTSSAGSSGSFFFQGGFSSAIPQGLQASDLLASVFDIKQNKIDGLAGNAKYPLKNTKVKVMMYPRKNLQSNSTGIFSGMSGAFGTPSPQPVQIGTATTNANGEFTVSYFKEIVAEFYTIHLQIETDDFIFSDTEIPFEKTTEGAYSIGTLNGLAKTYRLKFKTTTYDYDKQKKAYVKGDPIKDVKIKIAHEAGDWSYFLHPNLNQEGTRVSQGIQNDYANMNVANITDAQQIPCLFPNHYTGGAFNVDVAHEGYSTQKFGLNISEKNHPELFTNYLDKDVPVYVFESSLYAKDPVVKGKVLVEGTNAPVKGAVVTVSRPITGWIPFMMSATTNDKGEFEIADIPKNDKPYTLSVTSGSIHTYTEELNLNKSALILEKTILVSGKLLMVTGTVRDEDKNALKDAVVVWKTGGTPTISNDEGRFVLSNIKGKHWLVAKKPGFKDTEMLVEVKEAASGSGSYSINDITNLSASGIPGSTGSVSNSAINLLNTIYGGSTGTGSIGGSSSALGGNFITNYNNITNSSSGPSGGGSSYYAQNVAQQLGAMGGVLDNIPAPTDIGDVILKRFYLKLKVQDAVTSSAVEGAKVEFNGAEVGTTNAAGLVILNNVSVSSDYGLVVYGPSGSMYVASANNVSIDASLDTAQMTVQLTKGLKVSGKVYAAGSSVKGALIYLDGKDYLKTKTDSTGSYSFAIPSGNKTLWAVKSGFVGESKTQDFSSGDYTVDFNLKDAGFDASKLLGFDIMLTESKDLGGDQFEITGNFVNIPSNALFKTTPGFKIPFTKQKVKKSGSSVVPVSGEVVTDVSQIPITLWDYLKLKLETSSGIKVKAQSTDNTKGKIEGAMNVDIPGTFASLTGIKIPEGVIQLQYGTGFDVPAFTSDGSLPFSDTKLKLGSSTVKCTVYDLSLSIDFNKTFISKEGLDIAGSLSCDGFKFLPGLSLNIEQMRITTTGDIKNLKISVSPEPKISISAWGLTLSHIDIGSLGLKLGGDVKIGFSGSSVNIGFSNLNVTKGSLSGGTFSLSGPGIDLFGLLKIGAGASSGLTLMVMPNGKDFKLTGNVNFNFNQYINKAVKIDEFGIATDGNFSAKITTDVSVEIFGFAALDINKLGINTATKQIDVGGKLKFNVPGFGAGIGTSLHYKPGSISVDDIDLDLSLGGIGAFAGHVAFSPSDKKFAGNGSVKIASSPLDFKAGFYYSAGSFGATFNMGPAVILPIGPLSLDKIGGGFSYDKPASKFSVFGECRIKFAPDPSGAVAIDPTTFGITVGGGGPIFSASGTGKIAGISFANASFVMDIPARKATLDVTAGGSFNKIPGVNAAGNFVINAELGFGSSPYIFMGQAMNLSVPFLCSSSGGVAVAINYNVPPDRAATYHLPTGNFTGISAWAVSNIGITKANAKSVDVGIGHISYWLGNQSEVSLFVQLNGFNAGFRVASGWSAGAEACLDYVGCAGASAGAEGELNGQLDSGGIQSASASLSGWAMASIGCCGGGCATKICWGCWGVCPCGAKACFQKTVGVSYAKGSGFSFNL